jgi:hypothetical protein
VTWADTCIVKYYGEAEALESAVLELRERESACVCVYSIYIGCNGDEAWYGSLREALMPIGAPY